MLTRKQHQLICYIEDKLAETGISPSFEEMKEALTLKSKSGVHRLISALEERGFLKRLPNRARALEVVRSPERGPQVAKARAKAAAPRVPTPANENVIDLPLHGRIAAGAPIEAIEGQSTLQVPAALLGPGEHYALEVSGDSMVEAGILDGDFALIRKTEVGREGDIVVALVDGSEATLKYFHAEGGGKIRLDPANARYEAQRYRADQIRVQGRLAGLLRRY